MGSNDDAGSKIIGRKEQPRVLLIGLSPDFIEELQRMIPTTLVLVTAAEALLLRQSEWDAAVVLGDQGWGDLEAHLNVIAFRGPGFGRAESNLTKAVTVSATSGSNASEFIVRSDLPPDLEMLVRRDLLPHARDNAARHRRNLLLDESEMYARVPIYPFLADGDNRVLAGAFARSETSQTWAIPHTSQLIAWVVAAFRQWAANDPKMAIATDRWMQDPTWTSPAEDLLRGEVGALEASLRTYTETLRTQISTAQEALAVASQQATAGARRLLTQQGDALVDTVVATLNGLGFECEIVDESGSKIAKLEDLRVTDPLDPDWLALVEVRGYAKGAALYDLMRMERFVSNYAAVQGNRPPSVWYIVNSFIGMPPDGRDVPLAGHPLELADFAEGGGLVVDTRDLFRAWKAVESRSASASAVRQAMKRPGRFAAESIVGDSGPTPD